MERGTHRAATLAACFFASILAACSGAPPEDAPDYEVDYTAGGDRASGGSSTDDTVGGGATEEQDTQDAPLPTDNGGAETGGSTGGNGGSSGGTTPAPEPTKVTVKIDGVTVAVKDTVLWSEVSKPGEYDIFVKLTTPGTSTDIHVSATGVRNGCDNTANFITYRPSGDTQYMPKSTKDPSCGLAIESLPTAVGGRFKGSFNATLYGINVSTPKTKKVTLTFDVLREK